MRSLEDDPSPERKDDARHQIVSKIDSQVDKYKYRLVAHGVRQKNSAPRSHHPHPGRREHNSDARDGWRCWAGNCDDSGMNMALLKADVKEGLYK